MRYRVYCNLIVEADSPQEVFEFLSKEVDFWKSHIISEDSPAMELLPPLKTDDVYADIRRRYK